MKNRIIPSQHPISQSFRELCDTTSIIVFSGLPGVGKSLYINTFHLEAQAKNKNLTVIQWDMARKAFEIPAVMARYPMEAGTVHDGIKLMAGRWLIDTLEHWIGQHQQGRDIMLVEAPLVGHRFVELVQKNVKSTIRTFLESPRTRFLIPIPSRDVRKTIENARAKDVSEDALEWMGAKPSVMHQIWENVCDIGIKLGFKLQDPHDKSYNPELYDFVFSKVCRYRHILPLHITDTFSTDVESEDALHALDSLLPSSKQVNDLFRWLQKTFPTDKDMADLTDNWFNQ